MIRPCQAVLLAAGRGSRLSAETGEVPKALLPIGRRSLADPTPTCFLRRQIEVLRDGGVDDVVVVVGYLRERLRAALAEWAPWVKSVVNPTPDIATSGSLHSFQFAARSGLGVLDGRRETLLLDADIVYHRDVLRRLLEAPERSAMLVCDRTCRDDEEVLVYGTPERPRFLGKGLTAALVQGAPCVGEAVGIVKFAPADQALARETIDWLLGNPDAPPDSAAYKGFGPARRATEHEELTQRFMHYGRMTCVSFGAELPFMEVDTAEEYALLRKTFYPRLLEMEASGR
jgi:choline kinase